MKHYELVATATDDGNMNIVSHNDGFNAFELLGILDLKADDLRRQLRGELKPDVVFDRKVVKHTEDTE